MKAIQNENRQAFIFMSAINYRLIISQYRQ